MHQRIFISYRWQDTKGAAGRLYDALTKRVPKNSVFLDVASINPGAIFDDTIKNRLLECELLIVIIGKDWLTIRDEAGQRRIDHPNDLVRIELATALKKGIVVLPVLVDDASMPSEDSLPADLAGLVRHRAVHLRHDTFQSDVAQVIDVINRVVGPRIGWKRPALVASCVLAAALGVWVAIMPPMKRDELPAPSIEGPTDILGGLIGVVRWKLSDVSIGATPTDKVAFVLQSASDEKFVENLEQFTTDDTRFTLPRSKNIIRYWRVQAVRYLSERHDLNQALKSPWSKVLTIRQFDTALDRVKVTGLLTIIAASPSSQTHFKFYDGDTISGVEPVLGCLFAREISGKIAKLVKIQLFTDHGGIERRLEDIGNGKFDLSMAQTTILAEREAKYGVRFSRPYHSTGHALIGRSGSASESGLAGIVGKKAVGARDKSTSMKCLANFNMKLDEKMTLVEYKEHEVLFQDAITPGRPIDYAVSDTDFVKGWLQTAGAVRSGEGLLVHEFTQSDFPNPMDRICYQQDYGVIARKGEAELLAYINVVLDGIAANGVLERIKIQSADTFSKIVSGDSRSAANKATNRSAVETCDLILDKYGLSNAR